MKKLTFTSFCALIVSAYAQADLFGTVKFSKETHLMDTGKHPYGDFRVVGYDANGDALFTRHCIGTYEKTGSAWSYKVVIDFKLDDKDKGLLEKTTKVQAFMILLNDERASFTVTDLNAIRNVPLANAEDSFKFAVTPSIGFSTFFGGAINDSKNNSFSPATTAYVHFPLGKDISDGLLRPFLKGPKSTRIALTIGTPISGQRGYIIGPTIMFGANRFAITPGIAFVNRGNASGEKRRIGWSIGISYALSGP